MVEGKTSRNFDPKTRVVFLTLRFYNFVKCAINNDNFEQGGEFLELMS